MKTTLSIKINQKNSILQRTKKSGGLSFFLYLDINSLKNCKTKIYYLLKYIINILFYIIDFIE